MSFFSRLKRLKLKPAIIILTTLPLIEGCQIADRSTLGSPDAVDQLNTLAWIDREGHVEPINIPARNYIYAQLSPDGTQVALNSRDESSDIWIYDLQQESLRRLTLDPTPNIGPLWAPDSRLAYTRVVDGTQEIALQVADRSSPAEQLSILSGDAKYPTSFTADGLTLIYHTSTTGYDMWTLSLEGESKSNQQLLAGPFRETNGALSPDERCLAFESDESGQLEVYVSPYPEVNTDRIQISVGGGSRPRWNPNGNELFYIAQNEPELTGALMAVAVDTESDFAPGRPELLFENNFIAPNAGRQVCDISADGQRFLMIQYSS